MTWLEVIYAHRPGSFVRLEGGTLDIGILRPAGFTLDDVPPPGLFEETFESLVPLVPPH